MKKSFYPSLALDGIKKNKRMYFPYILTFIGIIAMFYIISFLQFSASVKLLPSGETVALIMKFGSLVISIFAVIFLFYTNSFLIKSRKKEFGLYNILGMNKRDIGKILFYETLFVYLISVGLGLFLGIVISKLAELGMVNIMGGKVDYNFYISPDSCVFAIVIFGIISLLIFVNCLRQIKFSTAVSLLKSENHGEKPPKANWVFGILGVLGLAVAYYLAVSVKNPISALSMFFIAVILVIIGTYLVLISTSVLICKILQKNKRYYYKKNHFISVSSMSYRMKRNGAGLASICVLATMVLVMISTTSCLYFGKEDSINSRYPRDINIDFIYNDISGLDDDITKNINKTILDISKENNIKPNNVSIGKSVFISGILNKNKVDVNPTLGKVMNTSVMNNLCTFYFIPISDYNNLTQKNEKLNKGEVIISAIRKDFSGNSLCFGNTVFNVVKTVDDFKIKGQMSVNTNPIIMVFVNDFKELDNIAKLKSKNGDNAAGFRLEYGFDVNINKEQQIDFAKNFEKSYGNRIFDCGKEKIDSIFVEGREVNRADFYGTYGGFFYLGIILSTVFIFAAVLIIYYKQISEGYEDKDRFNIMQKVGMTKKEIKKNVNSQLLTVFFLPLVFSLLHLIFAFPMIRKMLLLFSLNDTSLFLITTFISFAAFALLYAIVYKKTSNSYLKIVSNIK